MNSYQEGFATRCAEFNVRPERLMKFAAEEAKEADKPKAKKDDKPKARPAAKPAAPKAAPAPAVPQAPAAPVASPKIAKIKAMIKAIAAQPQQQAPAVM